MPVIEAQATGRPVVTSNIQPMVSVAGGSACLVNPLNTFSIRDGILSVIDNEDYRHMLIMKGVENIKRFTVRQVADSYIELYRELMNNN